MSAQFLAASTQFLVNTAPPVTAYPFTVGLWVRPTTTGAFRSVWSLSNSNTAYYAIYQWNTDQWNCQSDSAGTDADALGGTVTANSWHYLVCRYISATNRRLAVLNANGTTAFAQNTTSQSPAASAIRIGANAGPADYFSGNVAEYWLTNTDIQLDGLALQDATLRQLAYNGPFSIPHIRKDILEYHSFKKDLSSSTFAFEEDVLPLLGETLTNTNTVTIGIHPPLPYSYVRPGQTQQKLLIL